MPQGDLGGNLTVACYPRRWDSVSFYLGREVLGFGPEDRWRLLSQALATPTLLFVRNDQASLEMLQTLPASLEFVPRGIQGPRLRVGVIQRTALD